jgi:peptidoglycan/LPS O-acetylase OafA/YrhL
MAFVVVAGLVETIALSPVRGLTVVAAGTFLAIWGASTRVRRRAAFGLGAVTLAAVEIPSAAILPYARHLSGPALWVALVVAGVVVLMTATGLERGRVRVRSAIGRLGSLTEGWE